MNDTGTASTEESDRKPAARSYVEQAAEGGKRGYDSDDNDDTRRGGEDLLVRLEEVAMGPAQTSASLGRQQQDAGTGMNEYWDKQFRRESLIRKKSDDQPSDEFCPAQTILDLAVLPKEDEDVNHEKSSAKCLQKAEENHAPLSNKASKEVRRGAWRDKKNQLFSSCKKTNPEAPPAGGQKDSSLAAGESLPGAYSLRGPGARSSGQSPTQDREEAAVEEVFAGLAETEQDESSDTSLTPRDTPSPSKKPDSFASNIVEANMVDDAEPIFVARDVRRDNFKRHLMGATLALLAMIAIVVMVVIMTKDDTDEGVQCPADDRCCLPIEEQSVFIRCFCTNSTGGMYASLSEFGLAIYDNQMIQMRLSPYWNYYGSEDWDVSSCNPLNQGLLHVSRNEFWGLSAAKQREVPAEVSRVFLYLLVIYTRMDGLNWNQADGFMEDINICSWHGVGCSFIDLVHELRLSANGLSGEFLGPAIGDGGQLRILDLSRNNIWGTIPHEISNLSNLNELRLSELQLTGTLPATLGTMEQMRFLSLENNQLIGTMPSSYFGLPNIQNLELGMNNFSGTLPSTGYSASQMRVLRLNGNTLTGPVPPELSNLSNLELLNIGRNNFTGTIPEFLGTMQRLQFINLLESGLTGRIPDSFCENKNKTIDFVSMVVECGTTEMCRCCSSNPATLAAVRVRCAEDIPEQAIGINN